METGDILFIRGKGAISNTIRLIDRGEFSHVAVAVSETHIIEAEWNSKSVIRPFQYDDYEVYNMRLNHRQKDVVIRTAIALTGKWYDYAQLLGYVFKKLQYGTPKRLICSEVAYEVLSALGVDIGDRNISPNQLWRYLKDNTLKFIYQTDYYMVREDS